eukprot:11995555-Ditylum_brightwellii.AAC.1
MAEGSHSEDCDDASSGQCVLEEVDLSATNKAGSKRIGRESVDILVVGVQGLITQPLTEYLACAISVNLIYPSVPSRQTHVTLFQR